MLKPNLYGLDPEFFFTRIACTVVKVDPCFIDLPAKDWSDIKTLVSKFLSTHGITYTTPQAALQLILSSFNTITIKRKKHSSLLSYCKQLHDYFNDESVKREFNSVYISMFSKLEVEDLEQRVEQEGYKNGVLATLNGAKTYGKRLIDNLHDANGELQHNSKKSPVQSHVIPKKRERDEMYADDYAYEVQDTFQRLSIGTRIKWRAIELHGQYKKGEKLSPMNKKTMSCGLSSILDLVDLAPTSQMSLFGENEGKKIVQKFNDKYSVEPDELPSDLEETWLIVSGLAERENSVESGRDYIVKLLCASETPRRKRMLRLVDMILDIIEKHAFILHSQNSDHVTEYDYLSTIWRPILESLMHINNNLIRVKGGESINPDSTFNKQILYANGDKLAGFKVDFRIIYDVDGAEYDVGAGEAARDNSDSKLCHDLGKLLREGKDVLDSLLLNTSEATVANANGGWMIQTSGLQAELSSIHLVGDGLYVGVPQGKLCFPSSLSNMASFAKSLKRLFLFVSKLEKAATLIKKKNDLIKARHESISQTFNRQDSFDIEDDDDIQYWKRPTWYTPARGEHFLSKIPEDLYGTESTPEMATSTVSSTSTKENEPDLDLDLSKADEYGWIRVDEDKWHNTFSGRWSDKRPY